MSVTVVKVSALHADVPARMSPSATKGSVATVFEGVLVICAVTPYAAPSPTFANLAYIVPWNLKPGSQRQAGIGPHLYATAWSDGLSNGRTVTSKVTSVTKPDCVLPPRKWIECFPGGRGASMTQYPSATESG